MRSYKIQDQTLYRFSTVNKCQSAKWRLSGRQGFPYKTRKQGSRRLQDVVCKHRVIGLRVNIEQHGGPTDCPQASSPIDLCCNQGVRRKTGERRSPTFFCHAQKVFLLKLGRDLSLLLVGFLPSQPLPSSSSSFPATFKRTVK